MQTVQTDILYHTFPSGLRLVYRHLTSPVTYFGVMIGAGTRHEQPDESGLAHYIEHGVFKGTQNRTATQIINRIEDVGGELNAYTTKEETTFYSAVPTQYTNRAAELIADMVLHPIFPDEEMQREKQVIYDEIESYNDSPSELIYDDFESLLFSGNSLASPILGTKKTIRRFTAHTAIHFIEHHYLPARIVVFAETSKPFADIVRLTETYFPTSTTSSSFTTGTPASLPAADSAERSEALATNTTLVLPANRPHSASFRRHTHQTHVMLGGEACHIGHPDRLTIALLNNILGGGSMNSRLNMELREKRGLVYTVESVFQPLSDTGYWAVYFASEPENAEQCIKLVSEQLRRITDEKLSAAVLRKAVAQIKGQLAIADENRENRVLAMAKSVLYTNSVTTYKETIAQLKQITSDHLQSTARTIFSPDNIFTLKYE